MANIRRNGVYIIDTAGAGDIEPIACHVTVSKIRWVGGSTAGHEAKVTDSADNVFWDAFATGANYTESDDFAQRNPSKRTLKGLRVPTLASGKLYIYTD
jgi:hypothetical protein